MAIFGESLIYMLLWQLQFTLPKENEIAEPQGTKVKIPVNYRAASESKFK